VKHIKSVAPKLSEDVQELTTRQAMLRVAGEDLAQRIKRLKDNVKLARNQANNVGVGVAFQQNTTLQLRPPDNIREAAASTKISMYVNATDGARDGFLVYVGHPVDTHRQLKNVDTVSLRLRQDDCTGVNK
jgi:hypothetical protein